MAEKALLEALPPTPWTAYRKAAIPSLQWLCMDAFADFLSSSLDGCPMHNKQQQQGASVLLPDLLERLLSHWKQSSRLAEVLPCLFTTNLFVGPTQVRLDFSHCSALDATLLTACLSSGAAPSLLASTAVRTIHLDLSDCRQLLDEQVDAILRSRSTQLRSLNLSHCNYITDDGLRSLEHCSNLTSLSLASVPIDSATIRLVAEHCTLLQHLDICTVTFTQCIIEDLGKLRELEVLLMDQTEMPSSHPEGLAHVFANCNKLRIVDLSNKLMSDYQLEALASHCPSLERIIMDNLGGSCITCEGLEKCATAFSKLEAMTLLPDESAEYRNALFALRQSPCLREDVWDGGSCNGPSSAEYFSDLLEPSLCNITKLSIHYVELQPHVLPMIARCCTNLVRFIIVYCSFAAESMNDIPYQHKSLVSILRNNVGLQVLKIKGGRKNICLNEEVIKQIGPSCPNLRSLHLSLADGTFVSLHSKSLEKLYIADAQHVAFDIDCPQLRSFSCTAYGMEPAQLDLWKTLLCHGPTLQKLDIDTLLPEMLAELSKSWLFPLLRSLTVHTVTQQPESRKHYFGDEECKYLDTFLHQKPHICFSKSETFGFVDVMDMVSCPHLCQRLESIEVTIGDEPIALNRFQNLVSLSIFTSDYATPKLAELVAHYNHLLTGFRLRHSSLRSLRLVQWRKLVEFELDCPNLSQIELENCSLISERALTTLSDSSKNNVPSLVELWCQHERRGHLIPDSRTPEDAIVIQSCPVSVQRLSMERTWNIVELNLCCANLRTFKLKGMKCLQVLRLDCPKLLNLTVDIAPRLNNVTLNLPELIQMVFLLAVPPPEEAERKQRTSQQLLRKFMLLSTSNNDRTTEEHEGEDSIFHLEIRSSLPQLRSLSIQIDSDDDGNDGQPGGEEEDEESEKQQNILFTSHLPHYQAVWHILERATGLLNLKVDAKLLALALPRWMQSLEEDDVIPSEMTTEEAEEVVAHLRNACPKLWKLEFIQAYVEPKVPSAQFINFFMRFMNVQQDSNGREYALWFLKSLDDIRMTFIPIVIILIIIKKHIFFYKVLKKDGKVVVIDYQSGQSMGLAPSGTDPEAKAFWYEGMRSVPNCPLARHPIWRLPNGDVLIRHFRGGGEELERLTKPFGQMSGYSIKPSGCEAGEVEACVSYANAEEAQRAIDALNGMEFAGVRLQACSKNATEGPEWIFSFDHPKSSFELFIEEVKEVSVEYENEEETEEYLNTSATYEITFKDASFVEHLQEGASWWGR
ncbi:Leucine-rich repeat-containing protein 29 [Balamuthia mandrillaris]